MDPSLDDLALLRDEVHRGFWGNQHTAFAGWEAVSAGFAGAAYRRPRPIGRRSMRHWLLLTAHRGHGWLADGHGTRQAWPAQHTVLLAPGQIHAYGSEDDDWLEWWLLFTAPPGSVHADTALRPAPAVYPVLAPAVVQAADQASAGDEAAAARLVGLLIEALMPRRAPPPHRHQQALDDLRAELTATPEKTWNLHLLARRHGLPYDVMRRAFRQAYGVAPGAFVLQERIRRACHLLINGASVAEVAQMVGFDDPFYFSRCFRRQMGSSPRAFTNMNRT